MGIFSRNPDHRAEGDPNKSRGAKGRKTDEEGPASKSVRRDRKVARDEVSKAVKGKRKPQ